MIQHFPVLAVMSLFLGAFLVEIFGTKREAVRNAITFVTFTLVLILLYALIKPVILEGRVISYWMGNWEPVAGYAIGIGYEVDALGLVFAIIAITAFWLSNLYSFGYMKGEHHLGHFYTLFMMLCGSIIGFCMTGDLFNMYIMVEIMTFSAVALTGFNTDKDGALEAALKYLVICSVGSGFILTGIALIYLQCHTLNIAQLATMLAGRLTPTTLMSFGLIVAGFGVKSFMVPFHTPLADAHAVAPSPISMVLSGVVTKAGVYGMIRCIYMVFRAMDLTQMQILITTFGTVTMFLGVSMALKQHDFKRLLAFHSISQVGYILLAVGLGTTLGLTGGIFHAANHMLFKGLLFLAAGAVLHQTGGITDLDRLGGLSKKMPHTTICFLVGAAAISGIPPFNGFASKWLIYQAAYTKAIESGNFYYLIVTIAALTVSVMTLASFVKITQAVFFGQLSEANKDVTEAPKVMLVPMYIISALCLITGVGYKFFASYFVLPAVNSAVNVTNYIDVMMGDGYAAAAGVSNMAADNVMISSWSPVVYLILFVTVLAAACIVILASSGDRGRVVEVTDKDALKHSNFFSGEEPVYSHVSGSDMLWGYKHNFKAYYNIMDKIHTGRMTDYCSMVVIAAAVIIVFMFMFMR